MKKIDFHIHTVPTVSDSHFEFSMDKFVEYVEEAELDAVAVTNHNFFEESQFEEISASLPVAVFPGIEIDLCKCHMLLIADPLQMGAFIEGASRTAGEWHHAASFAGSVQP